MENTIENYLKFAALYIGQKLYVSYNHLENKPVHECKIVGVDSEYVKFECPFQNYDYINIIEPILLKPLSAITDEDAKELSVRLGSAIDLWNVIHENSIDLVKDVISNYEKVECLWMLPSRFTDKARELGYAIDWNNLSVQQQIEYGWVKLKIE